MHGKVTVEVSSQTHTQTLRGHIPLAVTGPCTGEGTADSQQNPAEVVSASLHGSAVTGELPTPEENHPSSTTKPRRYRTATRELLLEHVRWETKPLAPHDRAHGAIFTCTLKAEPRGSGHLSFLETWRCCRAGLETENTLGYTGPTEHAPNVLGFTEREEMEAGGAEGGLCSTSLLSHYEQMGLSQGQGPTDLDPPQGLTTFTVKGVL